jgi:hypothetical protein
MGYSNFHGNACIFLGGLKRGLTVRAPHVTFRFSKVGLDLASILRNLGVLESFEVIQKETRVK